jgi:hypothetical protein
MALLYHEHVLLAPAICCKKFNSLYRRDMAEGRPSSRSSSQLLQLSDHSQPCAEV